MRRSAWGALLVVAIVLAYRPALDGNFLWDDDSHITANPVIIGPLGLKEIWTTAAANYFPLVLTNFWLQHALWGLAPLGYHAVTIAFHVLAALLLWRVLLQLRVPGAWLGAALWALHPVQVESVAWICELKNTQSAVFFLLAIRFFLRWLDTRGETTGGSGDRAYYALTLACAVLAILSKPSTVMLPPVLLLLAWWRHGRVGWRDALWLVPFFALSAAAAGWTIWEQKFHSGASGPEWNQTGPERLVIAGRAAWFYLGKLLWPHPLAFIYPRWQIDVAQVLTWLPTAAALGGIAVLWWRRRGGLRPVLVAALFFVALLFPVLGFFDVYFFRYSFVGDHFQYLASMGPLALAAAGIATGWRWISGDPVGRSLLLSRRSPAKADAGDVGGALRPDSSRDKPAPTANRLQAGSYNWLRLAGVGMLLLGLGALTWRQCRVYGSNEALWRDTLAHNDGAAMAWLNLGDTLAKQGRHQEAIDCFTRATQIKPADPDGWNDMGCEMILAGSPAAAIPKLERALALKPGFAAAHNNLGNALRAVGRSAEAIAHYRRAIALKFDYGEAHNNLGAELAETGRPAEAVPHFEAALRINPRHAEAHDNLGNALRQLSRLPEAIARHDEALRLRPDLPSALSNLGLALAASGRFAEAIARYERALQLTPANVPVRANLAKALVASGRAPEGFRQLEEALRLAPASAEAHNNLGAALAEMGRVPEAMARFEEAVRLDPGLASAHLNLGVACGTAGRWVEAARHFERAAALQPESPAVLGQLAVALVNANRLEDAVPVFERALRLNPDSAELHGNFGQLMRAFGRNREASEHLEEAARLQRAAPRRR
ncbi:MAG: tetratricopeptide repeat protein [Verrucomicrobia bacterium]|nr:tetratricopeptide repeat protein [Verrucomicrobiota bacterium]